jgi:TonB family protein
MIFSALLLLTAAPPAVPPAPAAPPTDNASQVKVKPKFLSGPEPVAPEEAKQAGHHGRVVVTATVSSEGGLSALEIKQSSGSKLLDEAATAAISQWVMEPARDADGNAVATQGTFAADFINYGSNEPGGGLIRYSCDQFNRDMGWWHATFPAKTDKDHELKNMITGVHYLSKPMGVSVDQLRKTIAAADKDWANATKKCAAKPDSLFVDHLSIKPAIIALSKAPAR